MPVSKVCCHLDSMPRQRHLKRCPTTRAINTHDVATMELSESAHQEQPETGPGSVLRRSPNKRFEDHLFQRVRDTSAVVLHDQPHRLALAR